MEEGGQGRGEEGQGRAGKGREKMGLSVLPDDLLRKWEFSEISEELKLFLGQLILASGFLSRRPISVSSSYNCSNLAVIHNSPSSPSHPIRMEEVGKQKHGLANCL